MPYRHGELHLLNFHFLLRRNKNPTMSSRYIYDRLHGV